MCLLNTSCHHLCRIVNATTLIQKPASSGLAGTELNPIIINAPHPLSSLAQCLVYNTSEYVFAPLPLSMNEFGNKNSTELLRSCKFFFQTSRSIIVSFNTLYKMLPSSSRPKLDGWGKIRQGLRLYSEVVVRTREQDAQLSWTCRRISTPLFPKRGGGKAFGDIRPFLTPIS